MALISTQLEGARGSSYRKRSTSRARSPAKENADDRVKDEHADDALLSTQGKYRNLAKYAPNLLHL